MRGMSALLLVGACAVPPPVRVPCGLNREPDKSRDLSEESHDLGFGFRKVIRNVELPPGCWEAEGWFGYLYYRDLELSQVGAYSVAPSGRSIAYQDGPTGDIMLFIAESQTCFRLRESPGGVVAEYGWHEDTHELWFRLDGTQDLLGIHRRARLP